MFRKPPYYLTAYGLAVREGFKGTLEQWLESLRGEKGDGVELRYQDDKLQWRSVPPEGAQIPEDWEEDEWKDLLELEDIRGPVVEQTLEQAQQAAQEATEAARDAEMSKLFSEGAVQDALTHSNNAKQAETDAQLQANAAKAQAEAAAAAASSAGQSCTGAAAHAELAQRARQVAEAAEENARHAEEDAYNSAEEAKRAMEETGRVAAHAEDSEQRAAEYARDAGEAENNAQRAAGEAELMASHAQGHEQMAAQYAQEALEAARFVAVTTEYAVSEDGSTPPKVWETDIPELTAEKPFLWMKVNKNYTDGTAAADVGVIGRYSANGTDGSSTTIKLLYGVSSEPAENTVTGWQDTIPRMSENYPYLWIEISTETKTSAGGSLVIEKGIIGYYSTPGSGGNGNQGSGLNATAANLLVEILRKGYYKPDQSANITALAAALGVTEEETPDVPVEPDEPENPDAVTYTVTNNLTNVVNSNAAVSVNEGASYTAMLTAVEGYTLDTVTVTMGGVDITSTVYLDGAINIATVSGDIVITATAKAEPVEVAMHTRINAAGNTAIYSDGGETEVKTGYATYTCSKEAFASDTEVTVTIETSGAMYSIMYAGCYQLDSGFPVEGPEPGNKSAEKSIYYAEVLFNSYTEVNGAGTYTKTYTVKAGYGLVLVNPANTVAPVTDVTVTK